MSGMTGVELRVADCSRYSMIDRRRAIKGVLIWLSRDMRCCQFGEDQVGLSDRGRARVITGGGPARSGRVAEELYWLSSMEVIPYGRGTFGENS